MNDVTLETGDILLFYPASFWGRVSAFFSGGKYSHAAMVSIEDDMPQCLEVREFLGGRMTPLADCLASEPADVEIWRLKRDACGFRVRNYWKPGEIEEVDWVAREAAWLSR